MIEIKITREINISELYQIYRTLGWWTEEEDYNENVLTAIVNNSFCFAAAFENGKLIGIGRCLSDGASDAYIQDVGVLPEYQGKSIGKRITAILIEYLKKNNIGWIGLIAEPGISKFYEQFGFESMSDYIPMKLMVNKNA